MVNHYQKWIFIDLSEFSNDLIRMKSALVGIFIALCVFEMSNLNDLEPKSELFTSNEAFTERPDQIVKE